MKTLPTLSLLLLGLGLVQAAAVYESHQEWNDFKITHSKEYDSEEEEHSRFAIYLDNKRIINEHNALYEAGQISWEVGMNAFGDLTEAEFKFRMTGQVLPREHNRTQCSYFTDTVECPESYDWRDMGAVTEVKDQSFCGSCWAFAATGSMEAQYFKSSGELVSMSEQNLLDCSKNWGCGGGGWPYQALQYIDSHGINSEEDYPYEIFQHSCRQDSHAKTYKCSGCIFTFENDETGLQMALFQEGPVTVTIDSSPLHFQFYKNGIIDDPDCSSDPDYLDHAVLAVGYDVDTEGNEYWIIKNSWGKTWGDKGYFNMARNKDNMCGVATDPVLAKGPCRLSNH